MISPPMDWMSRPLQKNAKICKAVRSLCYVVAHQRGLVFGKTALTLSLDYDVQWKVSLLIAL